MMAPQGAVNLQKTSFWRTQIYKVVSLCIGLPLKTTLAAASGSVAEV